MKENIKFSICIPNYNYAHYIGETIESVLNQSYPHFEIIIVDNASTDKSWDVIQKYASKDNRIKIYRNNYNVGFAPNLDKAASKALNEYILLLSSDDLLEENALEKVSSVIKLFPTLSQKSLIGVGNYIVDEHSKKKGQNLLDFHHRSIAMSKNTVNHMDVFQFDGLQVLKDIFPRFGTPAAFCGTFYSKALYDSVEGYSSLNLISPDAHFAYKCLVSGAGVLYVNQPLVCYRMHFQAQIGTVLKNKNINIPIDRYILSNAYTDAQLQKAGLERKAFIKATVNEDCLNNAFLEFSKGNYGYAWRHWHFALAAYPQVSIKNFKVYLFFFFGLTGPIGKLIINVFLKLR